MNARRSPKIDAPEVVLAAIILAVVLWLLSYLLASPDLRFLGLLIIISVGLWCWTNSDG